MLQLAVRRTVSLNLFRIVRFQSQLICLACSLVSIYFLSRLLFWVSATIVPIAIILRPVSSRSLSIRVLPTSPSFSRAILFAA
mmetsp:Transcript_10485/g.18362  ORF Transcript_10485/g.18362 Transcript_10485/m.18362 type:complete len:83 (-) Transcript_10485:252-500(-)